MHLIIHVVVDFSIRCNFEEMVSYNTFEISPPASSITEWFDSNVVVLSDPPEPDVGEITLRSRQRLQSSDPATLKALRRLALSKSMRYNVHVHVQSKQGFF